MAVAVYPSQTKSLDRRSDRSCQQWSDEERWPEPNPPAELEAKEGAQHVKAGMREIENAKHAEDHRQTACHQEQQHAKQNAIQRRYDDKFEHDHSPPEDEPTSLRKTPERRKFAR